MKVNKHVYAVLFNVLVSLIMSLLMSFALTVINVWIPGMGLPAGFLGMWLRSYVVAFLVSTPVTFFTIPLVKKILRNVQIKP